MNKKVTIRTCIIVCILSMFFTMFVMASPSMEKITAYLNHNISVIINGDKVELRDTNDNEIYPISYEGTTYLPIRAISQLFGFDVEWDSRTGSIIINTNIENKESLITGKEENTKNNTLLLNSEERVFSLSDETIEAENGIACNIVANNDYNIKDFIMLSVKDKYRFVSFDCLSNVNSSVNVFNQNGKLLKAFYIKPNTLTHCSFNFNSEETTAIYFIAVNQNEEKTEGLLNILNLYGEIGR